MYVSLQRKGTPTPRNMEAVRPASPPENEVRAVKEELEECTAHLLPGAEVVDDIEVAEGQGGARFPRAVRFNPLWRPGFLDACRVAVQTESGRWTTAAEQYGCAVVQNTTGGAVPGQCLVPVPVCVYTREGGLVKVVLSPELLMVVHSAAQLPTDGGPPLAGAAPVVRVQHRKGITVLDPVPTLLRALVVAGGATAAVPDGVPDGVPPGKASPTPASKFAKGDPPQLSARPLKGAPGKPPGNPQTSGRVARAAKACWRGFTTVVGGLCFGVVMVAFGIRAVFSWRTCFVEDPATRQFLAALTALLAMTVWAVTAGYTPQPAYVLVGPALYVPAVVLQVLTGAPLPFQGTAAGAVAGPRNVDGLLWLYASLVALGVFLTTILLRVTAHALTPGMTALFFLGHMLACTSLCVLQAWQFDFE
jgi:hypothetical protein